MPYRTPNTKPKPKPKPKLRNISISDVLDTMLLKQSHSIPPLYQKDLRLRLCIAFNGTGPTIADRNARASGRKAYTTAQNASFFFFLAFAMTISPRFCQGHRNEVDNFISYASILEHTFWLDDGTGGILVQWAGEDNYRTEERFIDFIRNVKKGAHDVLAEVEVHSSDRDGEMDVELTRFTTGKVIEGTDQLGTRTETIVLPKWSEYESFVFSHAPNKDIALLLCNVGGVLIQGMTASQLWEREKADGSNTTTFINMFIPKGERDCSIHFTIGRETAHYLRSYFSLTPHRT